MMSSFRVENINFGRLFGVGMGRQDFSFLLDVGFLILFIEAVEGIVVV